jgi:hypothetical protein
MVPVMLRSQKQFGWEAVSKTGPSAMSDRNFEPDKRDLPRTITDEEIVTERMLPRRSFLQSSGALFAGVAGIVTGARAAAQDDPDKRPDDARKPEHRPNPDDAQKPEDRPKPDDTRKPEHRRKSDDQAKPEDAPKRPADPDKTY